MRYTLRQNKPDDHPSGFTLIEVMIVLAVISILAVVTIPRYQGLQDHYHLEASTRIVTNNLRQAKQLAMDQRKTVTVGLTSNDVKIFDLPAQDFAKGIQFDGAGSIGLTLQEFWACVSYDYRGFVIPVAGQPLQNIRVVLSSVRTGRSVAIIVEAQTGKTAIEWL